MLIVTGGAGFIGSNIAKGLNESTGEPVVIVDELSDGKKIRNLVDLDIADYFDRDEFLELVESDALGASVSAIVHQGACSDTTEWNGRYMLDNNYRYSRALLHYCLARDIPLIYASSASVYGASTEFTERPENERPLNAYGFSKLLFDRYVRRNAAGAKAPVIGYRYFNVYGPGEEHKGPMASVAWHFDRQIGESGECRLFEGSDGYDDGEQRRDFVYVGDVVKANIWALEQRPAGGIYNLGTGRSQPFNDVADAVIRYRGRGTKRYIPFPEGLRGAYQSFTEADLTALRRAGYESEFATVEQGVDAYLGAIDRSRE